MTELGLLVDYDLLVRFEEEALVGLTPLRTGRLRATARRFARWLAPRSVIEATTADVVTWAGDLRMTALARNERVGELHRFFGWLQNEGLVADDPTAVLFDIRPGPRPREGVDIALLVRFEDEVFVGLSPKTVAGRQGALLRFAKWVAPRSLLEATSGDIVGWLDDSGVAAKTRGIRISQLHSFYNWAFNEQLIDRDPSASLTRVRRPVNAGDFPELERGWWIAMERRALKRSSIESRAHQLRLFYDWMAPKSIVDANTKDIELWLDSRKLAPKSRYTSTSNLHMFYRWAQNEGLVETDPTVSIDRPRLPQTVPRPISDTNLTLAIDRADSTTKAVLTVAAFEGMRAGEIAGLRREDILEHLHPPMLIVSAPKGHRERILPLHPQVWEALEPILPRHGPVFTWPNGRQWPGWKVSALANTHLAGLQIPSSLHKLRAWFATNIYAQSGYDLRLTQELMGHSSPTTTAIYTKHNNAAATAVVGKLHVEPSTQ